jgi:hypothetical protein
MGIQVRSAKPNTKFHSGILRKLFPRLADRLKAELADSWQEDSWVFINIHALPMLVEKELREALPECAKVPNPDVPPAPPDDSMQKHAEYEKKIAADIAAQGKVIAEKNAAIARLDEHSRVNNLQPSDENIRLIKDFIDNSPKLPEHFRGRWTVQTVDLAVSFLKDKLEYGKAEPVAPVVAPPELTILSDGSKQLPLNTVPAHHHTVVQLRDLSKRRGEGQSRPGWSSARL